MKEIEAVCEILNDTVLHQKLVSGVFLLEITKAAKDQAVLWSLEIGMKLKTVVRYNLQKSFQ